MANAAAEELKAVLLHPTVSVRVSTFTTHAREIMLRKQQQAIDQTTYLQGQDVGIALIETTISTLLVEDTANKPPLFRLYPHEKSARLVNEVLLSPEVAHPADPLTRQSAVLHAAETRRLALVNDVALRALEASDARQYHQATRPPAGAPARSAAPLRVPGRQAPPNRRAATEPYGADNQAWCVTWTTQARTSRSAPPPARCACGQCNGAPCNQQVPLALEKAMLGFLRAGGRATSVARK